MKKIVYIYGKHLQPDGCQVIIEHIRKALKKHNVIVLVIDNLEKMDKDALIIPFGLIAAITMIKKGFSCKIALLIDAISFGSLSEFQFWFFRQHIPVKYKLRLFAQFFVFLLFETIVLFKSKSIILVSEYDKHYFAKIFPRRIIQKITVVPNGVDILEMPKNRNIQKNTLSLGIIANWNYVVFYNTKWFIDAYWTCLKSQFPYLQIIIAGKGIEQSMIDYWKTKEDIQCVGKVEHISEFYQSIDIALITLQKKCGILNKVLEAFAWKKIVLGLPHNFCALSNLSDAFFSYKDYDSLCNAIQTIRKNPMEVQTKIEKAYDYIQKEHSWEKNYQALESLILNYL